MLSESEIIIATKGKKRNTNPNTSFENYCIDSREILKGCFFIPIKGEKVDSHQYIIETVSKGAKGYFIACNVTNKHQIIEATKQINPDVAIIEVMDTLQALYEIGKYHREKLTDVQVIGVTGSVGKTTTKELIASVLKTEYTTFKTEKNYNGFIGLSLMLLKIKDEKIAVLEHGIDYIGEMELLSAASKPDLAVITMIGTSHIEKFGNQDVIAKEKLEICRKGIPVIANMQDEYLQKIKADVVIFYDKKEARIIENKVNSIVFETNIYENKETIEVSIVGEHLLSNVMAAIKVGEYYHISTSNIIKGLKNYQSMDRRFCKCVLKNGVIIIDDTYNASMDSMIAGIKTTYESNAKRKIVVLGDMLELGDYSKEIHEKVGECFKEYPVDLLLVQGKDILFTEEKAKKYIITESFFEKEMLITRLKEKIKSGDYIYVKASNGMKFNEIVKALKEE